MDARTGRLCHAAALVLVPPRLTACPLPAADGAAAQWRESLTSVAAGSGATSRLRAWAPATPTLRAAAMHAAAVAAAASAGCSCRAGWVGCLRSGSVAATAARASVTSTFRERSERSERRQYLGVAVPNVRAEARRPARAPHGVLVTHSGCSVAPLPARHARADALLPASCIDPGAPAGLLKCDATDALCCSTM
jgi:hypothetical protein